MKNLLITIVALVLGLRANSKTSVHPEMEKLARAFHGVIGKQDEAGWKKFILENYTQALINKPLKTKIEKSDGEPATTENTEATNQIDSKVAMYARLHNDFGNSKIISIAPEGEQLSMVLQNSSGLTGNFTFTFEKKQAYLIDGLKVEVRSR